MLHSARLLIACSAVALSSCVTWDAPRHPRPALPMPPQVVARYALQGPVVERGLAPLGAEDGLRFERGRLHCGDEVAVFTILRPISGHTAEPDAEPQPFVLCLPILAGGRNLMWVVAADLASRGYIVAWADRVDSALKRGPNGQLGDDLETLLRRTIVHNRMVLAWARQQPDLDADQFGVVGLSLGGIVGAALMATEPSVRAAALCVAGADLADLLQSSDEPRVLRWLDWRRDLDDPADSELQREIHDRLISDPVHVGGFVSTDKILLVHARFDTVVPRRHQDLLWESLGRPRRIHMPLGHYTAALALGTVFDATQTFFDKRFTSVDDDLQRAP